MEPSLETLQAALESHGGGDGLKYGTAGFRALAPLLPGAMHRIGVLAALRSRALRGEAVGAMITASHNKEPYNGAKLVEPTGAMLCPAWEESAGFFVNAPASSALCTLHYVAHSPLLAGPARVVVARDTRASSAALSAALCAGVRAAGGEVDDLGEATTPQLHFAVRARHRREPHALHDYYAGLRAAFAALVASAAPLREPVLLDCANGVGAAAAHAVAGLVPGIVLANARPGPAAPLNDACGADFVQKARAAPTVYDARDEHGASIAAPAGAPPGFLCASLDGDADRVVFYAAGGGSGGGGSGGCGGGGSGIVLADGDRFATLAAAHVAGSVRAAGLSGVSVAVAQTAYSNGAATAFLAAIPGVQVKVALTGVKHLERAVRGYDVGIYWEPNGHGTVLYSDEFRARLEAQPAESRPAQFLVQLGRLANQAVGDGVGDFLLVVAILARSGLTFRDWVAAYKEKAVANGVVRVRNKAVVRTADFDRAVAKPDELRARIEGIVGAGEGVRAFVRPSGTEDVVRVFAEADTQAAADQAATDVARAVYDTCEGVGERP